MSTRLQATLPQLIAWVCDAQSPKRLQAIEALGQQALAEVEHEEAWIRGLSCLLEVLRTSSDVPLLRQVLRTLRRLKPYSAASAVAELALATAENQLALSPKDQASLRLEAVTLLGHLNNEQAVVPLLGLLGQPGLDYRLRLRAAESLGRLGASQIGVQQTLPPLVQVVQNPHEPSAYVKESALKALGQLQHPQALQELLALYHALPLLDGPGHIKAHPDQATLFLKERLIEAMGNLLEAQEGWPEEETALELLCSLLQREAPLVRKAVAEVLGRLGDVRCLPALRGALLDSNEQVVEAALGASYLIGGEDTLKSLWQDDELPDSLRNEIAAFLESESDEPKD